MSYDSDDRIWVGDLDGFISISALNRSWDEDEVESPLTRQDDLCNIGDVLLLDGTSIRLSSSSYCGLGVNEWNWAVHESEKEISVELFGNKLEQDLLAALIKSGRKYAINRYAKWEKIPKESAVIASFPMGFKALLMQYLSGQGLLEVADSRNRIRSALDTASSKKNIIAYQRVSGIQRLIHELADVTPGKCALRGLNKNATREILSLSRLYYSVEELRFRGFSDVSRMLSTYALARETVDSTYVQGKYIRNWQKRYLHPLINLYPYSIRKALFRIACCENSDVVFQRQMAVNELAVIKLELMSMVSRAKIARYL